MRSKRNTLIKDILHRGAFGILNSKTSQKCDEEILETFFDLSIVLTYRYFDERRYQVPKSSDWYLNILPAYDEVRFKACLRVSRQQFRNILEIIVLKNQNANYGRSSLEIQLAVALFRLGHDGSGASYKHVGHMFGISDCGTVKTYTERIIKILIGLESKYITWPSSFDRKQIVDDMKYILPGCVGYIDGCHIPLFQAPDDDHEAYYSRKQQYAIHLQAVCDNRRIFRNVSIGYPASAHDARVFANSPIGQHPEKFMDDGQWLAGDSAYRLSKFLVTPFRDNAQTGTLQQRKLFNGHFSGQRVKIEQSFGALKKIFGSLQSLRVKVNKRNGHKRACNWILACIILYNIMQPDFEEDEDYDLDDALQQNDTVDVALSDSIQRDVVFSWFNTHF